VKSRTQAARPRAHAAWAMRDARADERKTNLQDSDDAIAEHPGSTPSGACYLGNASGHTWKSHACAPRRGSASTGAMPQVNGHSSDSTIQRDLCIVGHRHLWMLFPLTASLCGHDLRMQPAVSRSLCPFAQAV